MKGLSAKKLIMFALTAILIFSLVGCSGQDSEGSQQSDIVSNIKSFLKGDVTGEINKEYSTQWFDFVVKSIEAVDEYEGYTREGYKFVVVKVSEKNTFTEPIPMSAGDFELQAVGLEEEDTLPLSPINGSNTMMPEDFSLDIGESVEYNVVFEIPKEITNISFIYTEIDIYNKVGATFTIKHSL